MPCAVLIILDGVGVGELPDAAHYGDSGSDTLGNTARAVGGLELPNLGSLGLGRIHAIDGVTPVDAPRACFGRMREVSAGKDSTTGHWELMGVVTKEPFPTYPEGFPAEVMDAISEATGHDFLGNVVASGTEIIQRLGDEHVRTGKPIVYTSADSVFQIAAHEEVVPLRELYRICEIARDLLRPPHHVSRVIARPFLGAAGRYERTANRHDFSVEPPSELVLHSLRECGVRVVAIGKIRDLYAGAGIDEHHPSRSNADGMAALAELYADYDETPALIMVNLVDFDTLYGHRNDPTGLRDCLAEFDAWLAGFLRRLRADDLLVITADHGNDPTTPSTDHSREFVPLLARFGAADHGCDLGTRTSFCDVGATLAAYFGASPPQRGESFLDALRAGMARNENARGSTAEGGTAPGSSARSGAAEGGTAPGSSARSGAAKGGAAPGSSARSGSAEGGTAPGSSARSGTAEGGAAPGSSARSGTAKGGAAEAGSEAAESYTLLVAAACEARRQSYSPYSRFRVGAALLATSGRVFTGTNVENASFGLSLCAERAALAQAVVAGERRFEALAICADGAAPTPPCGACRQALREFGADLTVVLAGERGAAGPVRRLSLSALLPDAFTEFDGARPQAEATDTTTAP